MTFCEPRASFLSCHVCFPNWWCRTVLKWHVASQRMELAQIVLGVSGVVILAFAWPAWRRERRHRSQQDQQWEHQYAIQRDRQWSGIDVQRMASRIESLRSDYVAEVHARQFSQRFHESLIAAARQTISRLSFFARRHGNHEPDQG